MRRQSFRKLFILIVSVNFLLALAAGTLPFEAIGMEELQENELEEIEPQIVNGQNISANVWPQVVHLTITKTLATATPPTRFPECTGTLLARETIETARILGAARQGDVVLTAAHCIEPDESGRVTTQVAYVRGGGNATR